MYENAENKVENENEGTSQENGTGFENNQQNNQNTQQNFNQGYNRSPQNQPPKKKSPVPIIIVAVIVIIGMSGALLVAALLAVFTGVMSSEDGIKHIQKTVEGEISDEDENVDEAETFDKTKVYESADGLYVTDVSEVVEQNMPSVVAITSTTIVESGDYYDIYDFYFGNGGNGGGTQEQQAAGSGIIIKQTDGELLIVTNNHVVEDADKLKIQFNGMSEDSEGVDGYVKGTNSTSDVAVVAVKVKDIPKSANIKVASIGDSDSVQVGDGVVAIGNALGYGQSVTTGIISAKDRKVELDNGVMTLLQTDAAINGGNSGGALLNSSGEVIGINVAKYSSNGATSASIEGMGFAIPISSVKEIIGNLETMETRQKVAEADRGYLGIGGNDVSEEDAEFYNIPIGVIVTSTSDNSPAAKAGIAVRDIITEFDGQQITSMKELQKKLEYYKKGEKVKVTIKKSNGNGYEDKTVTVTLGDKSVLGK